MAAVVVVTVVAVVVGGGGGPRSFDRPFIQACFDFFWLAKARIPVSGPPGEREREREREREGRRREERTCHEFCS